MALLVMDNWKWNRKKKKKGRKSDIGIRCKSKDKAIDTEFFFFYREIRK